MHSIVVWRPSAPHPGNRWGASSPGYPTPWGVWNDVRPLWAFIRSTPLRRSTVVGPHGMMATRGRTPHSAFYLMIGRRTSACPAVRHAPYARPYTGKLLLLGTALEHGTSVIRPIGPHASHARPRAWAPARCGARHRTIQLYSAVNSAVVVLVLL